jgi:hypothetical protein
MAVERPEVAAWKAAYRELDSSALLSLVPVLDAAIEAAKAEFELWERTVRDSGEGHEFVTQHLQNAMELRDRGVDVSAYVAQAEDLADFNSAKAPGYAKAHKRSFAYLTDLTMRRRWILDVEARRRGLLPDPVDFPYPDPPSD